MAEKDFNINSGQDPMKEFQLSEATIAQKSDPEFGKKMSKKIWGYVVSGFGNYYYNRNARFIKNRRYSNNLTAAEVQTMFQDRFQFNGKQNYIRLSWNALQIVNRIISGLVGRWMQRGEKIVVQATDDRSQKDKKEEYDQIDFIIQYRQQLEQLQQASGVQMIPQDKELPSDKEELNLWQAEFQRLPEEILYELGCNDVLGSNGWFDVLKEKMLHDSAEVGLVGTYTWMDEQGVIHVEWCEPENMIYSATKYADMRDTSWRGIAPSMKISELRRRYGKEFHPNNPLALTEQKLFEIAQTAREYKTVTNLVWNDVFLSYMLRPYDEWNVRSVEFELKTVDSEPYTITTSKSTGTTYTQKGLPTTSSGKKRDKPSDNQKVVEDSNWNIYRGVYLPDTDTLLEWGLKKNMIRPQDPKEIGNAEFSYSFYMYQNYEMRNMAIPEKIEAAVDGMILALLKMQQVVARMRPTGAAIDESALDNIDYGLGDAENKQVDHKKLYDQTGDIYYRGVDAEGNRVPIPIQELANSGFLGQMDGLIRNYQFNYSALKDELGEDPNLISAALQPRVTGGNVEASQQMADYATDYIYRAYSECMKMTSRKVSCLLKDSVTHGSAAYRKLTKEADFGDRMFSTDIKFLPTDMEVQRFEAILNQTIVSNPDMLQFLDPFRLLRIAKENIKLSELLFRQAQKKFIIHQQMVAQQNQEATFKAQIESAREGEKGKQETEKVKGQVELESRRMEGETANKNAVVALAQALLSKGEPIPPYLMPLINATVENIMIPLVVQNEQQKQAIIQQMQQAQMQQQMPPEQQQQEEMQEQDQSQQPQQMVA